VDDEVSELRLVVTAPDYDAALAFYRDTLGLREQAAFSSPDGRVTILAAGRATLELSDPGNAAFIDEVEVGRRVAGPIRVAFEVADTTAMTDRLARAGAQVVAPPTRTPWSTVNARLDGPGGLHLTLFGDPPGEPPRRGEDEIMVGRVGAPERVDAPVLLAEADPSWPGLAASLAADIQGSLGDQALLLEHVGSTSVPGLAAKPLIDLVLAVRDPTDEASYVDPLAGLGYQLRVREPDWHEHRVLKLAEPAVNLHVFGLGSPEIDRMLDFRDHLRTDPDDRAFYERTKRGLARQTWEFVQQYADAKSAVVEQIIARAERVGPPSLVGTYVVRADGATPTGAELAEQLGLPYLAVSTVAAAAAGAGSPVTTAAAEAVTLAVAAAAGTGVLVGGWDHAVLRAALPGRLLDVPDLPGSSDVERTARAVRQLARCAPG
jgi:GrpB-like predicted nucleotidyltransferase (UPF0157 family)/predicted enzyme related to lactoylglutathione lyase